MKNQHKKKLALGTQTIRTLEGTELRQAGGGLVIGRSIAIGGDPSQCTPGRCRPSIV